MDKITKQVDRDEKSAAEQMGMFGTDFHRFTKIACVVALSYIPSLFKKYHLLQTIGPQNT